MAAFCLDSSQWTGCQGKELGMRRCDLGRAAVGQSMREQRRGVARGTSTTSSKRLSLAPKLQMPSVSIMPTSCSGYPGGCSLALVAFVATWTWCTPEYLKSPKRGICHPKWPCGAAHASGSNCHLAYLELAGRLMFGMVDGRRRISRTMFGVFLSSL